MLRKKTFWWNKSESYNFEMEMCQGFYIKISFNKKIPLRNKLKVRETKLITWKFSLCRTDFIFQCMTEKFKGTKHSSITPWTTLTLSMRDRRICWSKSMHCKNKINNWKLLSNSIRPNRLLLESSLDQHSIIYSYSVY